MMSVFKNNIVGLLVFVSCFLGVNLSNANGAIQISAFMVHDQGHREYRGHHEGYYGHGWHDHDHGYYGPGWIGPNVVINVPVTPYYVPRCEQVEVCNRYNECWLERRCD